MGQETKKEWVEQKEKRWFDSCIELKPFLGEIYDEIHAQDKPTCEHPKAAVTRFARQILQWVYWVDVCAICETVIKRGKEPLAAEVAVETRKCEHPKECVSRYARESDLYCYSVDVCNICNTVVTRDAEPLPAAVTVEKPPCEHPKDFVKRFIHGAKYAPYQHYIDACFACDSVIERGGEPADVAAEKPQDAPEIPTIDLRTVGNTDYPHAYFLFRIADCIRFLYGKQGVNP